MPSVAGSVSAVTAPSGNTTVYDVHSDGTLWMQFAPGGQFDQVDANVKSVSAGTDSNGNPEAFVAHYDGSLTLLDWSASSPTTHIANGVNSVAAEGNGKALVIDYNNFLWQYDPNVWGSVLPAYGNGNPEFQGEPSQAPAPANFVLLDQDVRQATPMLDKFGCPLVADLHSDGSVRIVNPQPNYDISWYGWITIVGNQVSNVQSISSVNEGPYAAPYSPTSFLYTVSRSGDMQMWSLDSNNVPQLAHDLYNAGGAGFKDVNVDWNSGHWVATTNTGQVYHDGQLIDSGVQSAIAGSGGSFYEVKTDGSLFQWSPQPYWEEVLMYTGRTARNPWGYSWRWILTNWTLLDTNVMVNQAILG
jgi:hypothetical protein